MRARGAAARSLLYSAFVPLPPIHGNAAGPDARTGRGRTRCGGRDRRVTPSSSWWLDDRMKPGKSRFNCFAARIREAALCDRRAGCGNRRQNRVRTRLSPLEEAGFAAEDRWWLAAPNPMTGPAHRLEIGSM